MIGLRWGEIFTEDYSADDILGSIDDSRLIMRVQSRKQQDIRITFYDTAYALDTRNLASW